MVLKGSSTLRFSPFEYELYDVETGRLIAEWSDEREEKGEKPLHGSGFVDSKIGIAIQWA